MPRRILHSTYYALGEIMKKRRKYKFDHNSRDLAKSLGITDVELKELDGKYDQWRKHTESVKPGINSRTVEYVVNNMTIFEAGFALSVVLEGWRALCKEIYEKELLAKQGEAVAKTLDTLKGLVDKAKIVQYVIGESKGVH